MEDPPEWAVNMQAGLNQVQAGLNQVQADVKQVQADVKQVQADVKQVQAELKTDREHFTAVYTNLNNEISGVKASVEGLGIRLSTLEAQVKCVFSLDDQRNARFLARFPQHRLCVGVAGTTRAAS